MARLFLGMVKASMLYPDEGKRLIWVWPFTACLFRVLTHPIKASINHVFSTPELLYLGRRAEIYSPDEGVEPTSMPAALPRAAGMAMDNFLVIILLDNLFYLYYHTSTTSKHIKHNRRSSMRWETVEQILKVIAFAANRFKQGDSLERSYQHAVSRVAQEYRIAYQTIGDACRRRLGLDNVGEFKTMLRATLEGNPSDLRHLILRKTSTSYHSRINDFFSEIKYDKTTSEPKQPDTFVTYTVQLRKTDSDILKALSQLLGNQPEEILVKVAVEAIKERMKKTVNQL
jgi:hypothetical protein